MSLQQAQKTREQEDRASIVLNGSAASVTSTLEVFI